MPDWVADLHGLHLRIRIGSGVRNGLRQHMQIRSTGSGLKGKDDVFIVTPLSEN